MAVGIKKYNPGFLSDDEIVDSFCVRKSELESLLESLESSEGNSNVHSIVIGPRGSGKTYLLLRVAAEIRRNVGLSLFHPVVFAEESYEVSTVGEFWLECLGHLAEQAPEGECPNLQLSYNDLRAVRDDSELANRCLGAILHFADRQRKRIVLIVENLNMLFSDIDDEDAGWRLRHTLQNEPRILLLGSATSRFDEIDHPDHALYDLFQVITLRHLDTEQCMSLWQAVSGQPSTALTVRPLEILTGGNPRLLTIIALYSAGRSFHELKSNLLDLVDDHTEYFKSHLDSLPALERKIYLTLARLWKPATAREVADQSRVDINKCSALLKRLVERGGVVVAGGTPRRRQYYLTERLYNIYYLLRRDRGSSKAVEALIDFMVCLYSPEELWDVVVGIYQEARLTSLDVREPVAQVLIEKAHLLADMGHEDEAIAILEQVTQRLRRSNLVIHRNQAATAALNKVLRLSMAGRYYETIRACDDLLSSFGTNPDAMVVATMAIALDTKGTALIRLGNASDAVHAYDKALAYFDSIQVAELDKFLADTMLRKGVALLESSDPSGAVAAFDTVVARFAPAEDKGLVAKATNALLWKMTPLFLQKETFTERDFSLLLDCLAKEDDLRSGVIPGLMTMIVSFGLPRALNLILNSPSAAILVPLVTALQQELGMETRVAKEVDEVALDVRRKLEELIAITRTVLPTSVDEFLKEEVNLNQSRLNRVDGAVFALSYYLSENLVEFLKMEKQGSYAMGTIIKPVKENSEFDADIQVVMNPNDSWEPKDYIGAIYDTLKENGNYSDKLQRKTRCVTVNYAGDFHLDVVPRVTIRGQNYVCNRNTNDFEPTDGNGYRDWFNEKSRITGGNLKRVIRLLKYFRDHKNLFTVNSILLTTLVGKMIAPSDEGSEAVSTVVGTLETVLIRMDDFLHQSLNVPEINNPVLPGESFNRHWTQSQYDDFKFWVQTYARIAGRQKASQSGEEVLKLWHKIFEDRSNETAGLGDGGEGAMSMLAR